LKLENTYRVVILNEMKMIAAVIPAFNESKSIQKVVSRVLEFAVPIVVDDGSTDDTNDLAKATGCTIVTHRVNMGYEKALETGIKCAIADGYRYIVTLDADGQHDPTIIKRFAAKLDDGFDIVVGRRDKMQRIGEIMFDLIAKYAWNFRDPLSGMKAYRAEIMPHLLDGRKYDSVGTKFTIRAVRRGFKVGQIQIETRERVGTTRFGSGWRANKKIILAMTNGLLDLQK
jgi:glycosyltransferase involved in cell wall biosynthesis